MPDELAGGRRQYLGQDSHDVPHVCPTRTWNCMAAVLCEACRRYKAIGVLVELLMNTKADVRVMPMMKVGWKGGVIMATEAED